MSRQGERWDCGGGKGKIVLGYCKGGRIKLKFQCNLHRVDHKKFFVNLGKMIYSMLGRGLKEKKLKALHHKKDGFSGKALFSKNYRGQDVEKGRVPRKGGLCLKEFELGTGGETEVSIGKHLSGN